MAIEKLERQKENISTKLQQTEKDLQLALKAEQQAHEEDIERLTKEKVTRAAHSIFFFYRNVKHIFHQAFVVPLGQIMQYILRWEHFKYFFSPTKILFFQKRICIIKKHDSKSASF